MTQQDTVHQVIRLKAADFKELIPYLSEAFRNKPPDWFARNLPAVYQPTDADMANNYAVRIDGRIAAVVGVFPLTMRLGDSSLRVAGIGGVSTDPTHRRLGLMKLVMDHVLQSMRDEGYPLSWLGGQRQRYRYWGWERAGVTLYARLTQANLRHEPRWQRTPTLKLEPITAGSPHLPAVRALHDAQLCRMDRPRLYDNLIEWGARPMAGLDAAGRVAAYACLGGSSPNIDELVARDADAALGLVRAVLESEGDLQLRLDPLVEPAVQPLIDMAEMVRVEDAGNWQVFDWPTVVTAMLQAVQRWRPLMPGRVVLAVEDQVRFEMRADGRGATCTLTDAPAALSTDGPTMTRLLFGPLRPSQVMTLPADAAVLDQWCPLPLYLGRQDGV